LFFPDFSLESYFNAAAMSQGGEPESFDGSDGFRKQLSKPTGLVM